MPIQLRTTDNKVQILTPQTRFVEVVDDQQHLVSLVWQDQEGLTCVANAPDKMIDRYCRMFGLTPCESRTLPNHMFQDSQ